MNLLVVTLRFFHIVLGTLWVGMAVFVAVFLTPALREAGAAAGPVMAALQRRRLMTVLPLLALGTMISGGWLYWRDSDGFDRSFVTSRFGLALGIGGLIAIAAYAVGMEVTRPAMLRAGALTGKLAAAESESERTAIMTELNRLRARGAMGANVVAILLLIAAALMAVARYL